MDVGGSTGLLKNGGRENEFESDWSSCCHNGKVDDGGSTGVLEMEEEGRQI